MSRFWTLSGAVASAASLAIVGMVVRAAAIPVAPSASVATTGVLAEDAESPSPYKGPGSCSATACHGGTEPFDNPAISHAFRNEHSTWINKDAHAGAYEVLLSERSNRIAELLSKTTGKKIEASADPRCLACHETPHPKDRQSEGVSCESCHGASQKWLTEHTVYDWKGRSAADKAANFGFNDLNKKATRAENCAGCHVGSPARDGIAARDVNHDLIAAGHPRLNWEFSAYSRNYPPHWRITPPEAADLDARLWMIGQVQTMVAALDLLTARADEAVTNPARWPEFSEYGCFSCHFSLKLELRTATRDKDAVPLGSPTWGSWTVPMLKELSGFHPGIPNIDKELTALRKEMGQLRTDPKKIKTLAADLKKPLAAWLKDHADVPLQPNEVTTLFESLRKKNADKDVIATKPWDTQAQLYLGLAAVHASQKALAPATENTKVDAELKALVEKLHFKDGFDSPRDGK